MDYAGPNIYANRVADFLHFYEGLTDLSPSLVDSLHTFNIANTVRIFQDRVRVLDFLRYNPAAWNDRRARGRTGALDADIMMLYALMRAVGPIHEFSFYDTFVPCDTCSIAMHSCSWEQRLLDPPQQRPTTRSIAARVPAGDGQYWHFQQYDRGQLWRAGGQCEPWSRFIRR